MTRAHLCGWVVVFTLLAVHPAFAQRGPHATPPGQAKRAQQVPTTSGFVPASSNADLPPSTNGRIRTFGAWLDDATTLAPGDTWLALSLTKWDMPIATGADAPVIDLSAGLSPRVQGSITVPYYRVTDRAGATLRGLGDLYVGTKIVLREVPEHGVGIAIGPTLEILSDTSIAGTGLRRMNWILPVNLERRFDVGRLYASAGYFSRGVLFASGAFEHALNDQLAITVAATQAYSTDNQALSDQIGLGRSRVDLSGTASYAVSPALAVFGSLGRTVWGLDEDSTRLLASVGVSVNIKK